MAGHSRWIGATLASLVLLFCLGMLLQWYAFWNDPPPILTAGRSMVAVRVGMLLAALIIVVVGLYIARNTYRRFDSS